ncbi:MAG: TPM domain-containing protein [Trueperella sp.]|nr:TPM domain-containing protein [Trueperella sp.]
MALEDHLLDEAGVIADDADVLAAINQVPGGDMWVVIVPNFDGIDAVEWAQQTHSLSGLDKYDAVFAFSVESREFGGYTPTGDGISREIIDAATNRVMLDQLSAGNWDAGIKLLAENVRSMVRTGDITLPAPDRDAINSAWASTFWVAFIALIAVVVLIVFLSNRNKKKSGKPAGIAGGAPTDPVKLRQHAGSELIAADDDVRAARAELEFARAEFGYQATADYAAALESAQEAIQQAFALRTELDNQDPASSAPIANQILQLVGKARHSLAEQEQGFSQLRDLARRAPEKISELSARSAEIDRQLPVAVAQLANLRHNYPPESLATLQTYPDQITTLLSSTAESLAEAQKEVDAGNRNGAVAYTRLAEGTVGQAGQLLEQIEHAQQLLTEARARLERNVASLSSDVADAQRLGGADSTIAARADAAREVLARATAGSQVDLILLNSQLEETEAALDLALTGVREQEENRLRMETHVSRAKETAELKITAADEMITRYRSEIGSTARAYLNEAIQHFRAADSLPALEQVTAYQQARTAAENSYAAAMQDVQAFTRHNNVDAASAIVGGIARGLLWGSLLSGGSNNRHSGGNFGGGFGGGNFGGGFSGSGGGVRKGF